ncbi:MAG: hypothetical protein MUC83_06240 [Pirellula sp.]|jgi:hypothetical protein|nr:hypothetical protein [Pirellula sp.]
MRPSKYVGWKSITVRFCFLFRIGDEINLSESLLEAWLDLVVDGPRPPSLDFLRIAIQRVPEGNHRLIADV